MDRNYLMAIDQGTTGSTVQILDLEKLGTQQLIAKNTVNFTQHYPKTSWVEHDLNEIWTSVQKASQQAIKIAENIDSNFSAKKIKGIGIANQRETLCIFSRKTSEPLRRAIVWQCKRSMAICEELRKGGYGPFVQDKTGLLLDPYFTGSKILWTLRNDPEIKQKLSNGTAVLGTIDTYLISRLSHSKVFATEASNASRTLLFDIKKGEWNLELLEIFGLKNTASLAQIHDSASKIAYTKGLDFLPDGIPICGVLGDQQAALAGQTCFKKGEVKCTYGTGAFLLLQLGEELLRSHHGLLTTVNWSLEGTLSYSFEGSTFIAGAAIQFLRDNLNMIDSAAETAALADNIMAAPEIYFVPALSGLGAPWWNPNAKGAFFGLSRGSQKNQMIRATLEGMTFQVYDLLEAMKKDYNEKLEVLRVDGGASANNLLMNIQANIADLKVERPNNLETTGYGAALFASLGLGIYSKVEELYKLRQVEREFHPDTADGYKTTRLAQIKGWKKAIEAVQVFSAKD